MGRSWGLSWGVLEGLKTGKSTLVGAVAGALVGALVGPLVGQILLLPALCVAHSWEIDFYPVRVLGRVVFSLYGCPTPAQHWIRILHPWVQEIYPVLGLGSGGRLLRHVQTPTLHWIHVSLRIQTLGPGLDPKSGLVERRPSNGKCNKGVWRDALKHREMVHECLSSEQGLAKQVSWQMFPDMV